MWHDSSTWHNMTHSHEMTSHMIHIWNRQDFSSLECCQNWAHRDVTWLDHMIQNDPVTCQNGSTCLIHVISHDSSTLYDRTHSHDPTWCMHTMQHSITGHIHIRTCQSFARPYHASWCDMTHSCDATGLIQTLCRIVCESCRIVNDATHLIPVIKLDSFTHTMQHDSTEHIHIIDIRYREKRFRVYSTATIRRLMTQHDSFWWNNTTHSLSATRLNMTHSLSATRLNMTHSLDSYMLPSKTFSSPWCHQNWAPCDVTCLIHTIQYDSFTCNARDTMEEQIPSS